MMKQVRRFLKSYKDFKITDAKREQLLEAFNKDFEKYNSIAPPEQIASKEFLYPCLFEKTQETAIEPIYFYQDSWAFERIHSQKPDKHVDIGSHNKFIAFLSKLTDLSMVDIRPLSLEMSSVHFIKGDILNLPFENGSINSLSSLCVIEHIGLGRYGDEIDPLGSEKAFNEINRILNVGANFYMSVPVEEINKVYFNAHRAFNEEYLLEELLYNYEVEDRKYIYGKNFSSQKGRGFGVGCYHLKKTK